MNGVIGNRELVLEAPGIIREFGLGLWVRCVVRALRGERFTFLEMVMA